ncbi:DUF4405 domain-containing protein [Parasedimentitalea psychrophila]|uniref:DUF4405 domain-containing protein n=1 Tax=Parasedimentitalea psychrophila TaxID=2997337 RepID=A0A9Y2P1T7_9RHOB|nr:DUF4405 domain-containing protein [Parasedimentitalea psychrophila]WIY25936.1 DUF4405 domain-containing protein [Parasedimentitalea psychrophila]
MKLRSWVTPLTIGSFVIMAVSGTLMFFRLKFGLIQEVHEWAGWVLLAAVIVHLVMNWRAFGTYFKQPLARAIMGACAVVLALSFIPISGGGGGGNPAHMVMRGIGQANIETVIAVSGLSLEDGLQRLKGVGITAEEGMTMPALTQGDQELQRRVIQTLF